MELTPGERIKQIERDLEADPKHGSVELATGYYFRAIANMLWLLLEEDIVKRHA